MNAGKFFVHLVDDQKRGRAVGITSVCSAHPIAVRAAIAQAAADGTPALIESTSNQVNQDGGYTGMVPREFQKFVRDTARLVGVDLDSVILGGDHLGPYPWRRESAELAMDKARKLVSAYVRAGYQKIHLDASMALVGDPTESGGGIPAELVAEREAELAWVAEDAVSGDQFPVYVIGTEVPTPGGIVEEKTGLQITSVDHLRETVELCRKAFDTRGLSGVWGRVVAVVAQPGVEFGDETVVEYDRDAASELCHAARAIEGLVLEGHSTDYQRSRSLEEMVEDGVAVLKVGPAITFAIRECLFGLEAIERELLALGRDLASGTEVSRLRETVEAAMIESPAYWHDYYTDGETETRFARAFSLSDRIRYYWSDQSVRAAVQRLMVNLKTVTIPLPLLSQYVPRPFWALRERYEEITADRLLEEAARVALREYPAHRVRA